MTEDIAKLVNSWVIPGRDKIRRGALESSPYTDPTIVRRNSSLSIPNNTQTLITFPELRINGELEFDGSSGFYLPGAACVIGVIGGFEFPPNGAGVRAINYNLYDESEVYITGTAISLFAGTGLDYNEIPVAYHGVILDPTVYAPQIPKKLKFSVYQNSGGALNLTWCQLSVFVVQTGLRGSM